MPVSVAGNVVMVAEESSTNELVDTVVCDDVALSGPGGSVGSGDIAVTLVSADTFDKITEVVLMHYERMTARTEAKQAAEVYVNG